MVELAGFLTELERRHHCRRPSAPTFKGKIASRRNLSAFPREGQQQVGILLELLLLHFRLPAVNSVG